MSVANEQAGPDRDGHSRDARTIGNLLSSMRMNVSADNPTGMPVLYTAADRHIHTEKTLAILRARKPVPSLTERRAAGAQLRLQALKVLDRLSLRGTITVSVTRTQWQRLAALARYASRPQDWMADSGPVIGATNATLGEYLGVRDTSEALEPLLRNGLIIPWRSRGNGRRHFFIVNKGQNTETISASGFSLAPLITLLDVLEKLADAEAKIHANRVAMPAAIKATIAAVRSALKPHLDEPWAQEMLANANTIGRRAHDAKKGRLEAMESLYAEAINLSEVAPALPAPTTQSGEQSGALQGKNPPDIYDSEHQDSVCSSLPAMRSGDRSEKSQTYVEEESSKDFGIERSGFSLEDAPALFPFYAGMIAIDPRHLTASIYALARNSGVSLDAAQRAIRTLGELPALLCVLITGQHLADGEILKTPEAYFRGLLKRAAADDLNIGHSIFSRRDAPGKNQRSPKRQKPC